jgi:hypothetical protein
VALAVTVTVPLTVAPFAGAVSETTGGVVSLFTVMEALLVAVLPAASLATAVRVCDPLAAVFEFHE